MTNQSQLSLWYAYYDSLFSSPQLTFPYKFAEEINSSLSPVAINQKRNWPRGSCPELAQCYELLQDFLGDPESWIVSHCASDELRNIQSNLNMLMNYLQLQKSYAELFWKLSPRRIQASATHFYHYLQFLTRSVIPYPSMTMFQCKAANKLCINLVRLQKLMNRILQKINKISEFLGSLIFEEQQSLTYNFMENLVYFMKKIPTIKRSKIEHVPNLTKYVILNNPIELSKTLESPRKVRNRKKSNTIGSAYKCQYKSDQSIYQNKSREIIKEMGDFHYKIQMRSYSTQPKMTDPFPQDQPKKEQKHKTEFLQKLFTFPATISKYSEATRMKKNTFESFRTLTTKISSIEKNKSSTLAQSNGPVSPVAKRVNTEAISKRKTIARMKKRSLTKFYDEEEERLQLKSISSSHSNMNIVTNNLSANILAEQQSKKILSRALQNQKKQERGFQALIEDSQRKNECLLDVGSGQKKLKGWDLAKKYTTDIVVQHQLKKLLNSG